MSSSRVVTIHKQELMFVLPHWWGASNSEENPQLYLQFGHSHMILVCLLLGELLIPPSEEWLPFSSQTTTASLSFHNSTCQGHGQESLRKNSIFERFSLSLNIIGNQKLFSTHRQQNLDKRILRANSSPTLWGGVQVKKILWWVWEALTLSIVWPQSLKWK